MSKAGKNDNKKYIKKKALPKLKRRSKAKYKFISLIFMLFLLILFDKHYYIINRKNKSDNSSKWEKQRLIVHALGKINNTKYSNSFEGLNYWYFEKKMRLMEADFNLTLDNHTVLTHGFGRRERPPTLAEFKKNRVKGYLTPLSFEDLVIFMEQHDDLYIITDTKFDDITHIQIQFDEMTEILSRHKNVNNRFIIEIYNERMYLFLKEKKYPFKYFMFTLYKRWENRNYTDLENIFSFCKEKEINGIIMYSFLFNSRINKLSKKYSIPLYVHTENNIFRIAEFLKRVRGVFSDEVDNSSLDAYFSYLKKFKIKFFW